MVKFHVVYGKYFIRILNTQVVKVSKFCLRHYKLLDNFEIFDWSDFQIIFLFLLNHDFCHRHLVLIWLIIKMKFKETMDWFQTSDQCNRWMKEQNKDTNESLKNETHPC